MDGELPADLVEAIDGARLDELVRFDTSNMGLRQRAPSEVSWRDEAAMIRLSYEAEAELGAGDTEREVIKDVHDRFASNRAGLIEAAIVEPPRMAGERVLHLVAKTHRGDAGMVYLAMVRVPLVAGSFDVSVVCAGRGRGGEREASVLAGEVAGPRGQVRVHGELTAGSGWTADLFGGGGSEAWIPNRADDAGYDRAFPLHPLSIVRRVSQGILGSISLSPACVAALHRPLPDPGSGWV